jgi:hypothetical protein
MKSIQQQWFAATVFLSLRHTHAAFQTAPSFSVKRATKLQVVAGVDPNDIVSFVSSGHDVIPSEVSAFLSTTLSAAVPAVAHGHSNPLFGPPDPYLAAGKSIAPSARALVDMGITTPKSVSEMLSPESSETFQQSVTAAVGKGWKVLDGSKIHGTGVNHLPGFSDTKGIFGTRMIPYEDPETFSAEVKWAAGYFSIMDKLPFVAFYYALAEFFVLRPGVDLYKEEIEDDPEGVLADTVSVAIVRVGAFALITMVTVLFAGA